jgi:hypothetical protein
MILVLVCELVVTLVCELVWVATANPFLEETECGLL